MLSFGTYIEARHRSPSSFETSMTVTEAPSTNYEHLYLPESHIINTPSKVLQLGKGHPLLVPN